jgi:hypothetical protein
MTPDQANVIAVKAGNDSMTNGGRVTWNTDDYEVANDAYQSALYAVREPYPITIKIEEAAFVLYDSQGNVLADYEALGPACRDAAVSFGATVIHLVDFPPNFSDKQAN